MLVWVGVYAVHVGAPALVVGFPFGVASMAFTANILVRLEIGNRRE